LWEKLLLLHHSALRVPTSGTLKNTVVPSYTDGVKTKSCSDVTPVIHAGGLGLGALNSSGPLALQVASNVRAWVLGLSIWSKEDMWF
jgi:hypothetical protein